MQGWLLQICSFLYNIYHPILLEQWCNLGPCCRLSFESQRWPWLRPKTGGGSVDRWWGQYEPRRLAHTWDMSAWVRAAVELKVALALGAPRFLFFSGTSVFCRTGPLWWLCHAKLEVPGQATPKYWGWCPGFWWTLWEVFETFLLPPNRALAPTEFSV